MNLILITDEYGDYVSGGIGTYINNIIHNYRDYENLKIYLISSKKYNKEKNLNSNIEVFYIDDVINNNNIYNFLFKNELNKVLQINIFKDYPQIYNLLKLTKGCKNLKIIYNSHLLPNSSDIINEKKLLSFVDIISCPSRYVYKIMKGKFDNSKIFYLPHGYTHNYLIEKDNRKKKFILFLFIGRIDKLKGIETAIKTVYQLNLRNFPSKLVIAGRGNTEWLFNEINKFNSSDNIKYIGYCNEIKKRALYTISDYCFNLSSKETYGYSMIESFYNSTPSIISDIEPFEELIDYNDYFLKFKDIDKDNIVHEITNKIICLYKLKDSTFKKEYSNIRKIVINNTNFNKLFSKTLEQYQSLF